MWLRTKINWRQPLMQKLFWALLQKRRIKMLRRYFFLVVVDSCWRKYIYWNLGGLKKGLNVYICRKRRMRLRQSEGRRSVHEWSFCLSSFNSFSCLCILLLPLKMQLLWKTSSWYVCLCLMVNFVDLLWSHVFFATTLTNMQTLQISPTNYPDIVFRRQRNIQWWKIKNKNILRPLIKSST